VTTQTENDTCDAFVDMANGELEVTSQDFNDDLLLLFIMVGVLGYFRDIVPRLTLMEGLPNRNNFIYSGHWDCFALDPLPNISMDILSGLNTLNFAWGTSNNDYRHHLLYGGHNIAMGVSAPLIEFMSMRNRPDLPIVQDNVTVTEVNFALKQGCIKLTGKGYYETCCANIDFSYSITIELSLNSEGQLQTEVVEKDVDLGGWMLTVFRILSPLVVNIAIAIAEAVASDSIPVDQFIAADAIDLGFEELGSDMFNIVFTELKVNENGVFFLGNIESVI
jgi:hypothetical protein